MVRPTSKINFGNVTFRREQIEGKADYVAEDGRQRYRVTFKTGQKIDYPEQKANNAFVTTDAAERKVGLYAENIKNATIYGNPGKSDLIHLAGDSSGNSVVVDNDGKAIIDKSTSIGCSLGVVGAVAGHTIGEMLGLCKKQEDSVTLGSGTKDNTVRMGKQDTTYIAGASYPNGIVEGEGVCEQDVHKNGLL